MKYLYRNATEALPYLMQGVLRGETIPSRNGDTKEQTFVQVQLTNPWPLEITTPGRKVSLPAQIAETMWVLAGRNDVEFLSHYLPRAAEFSDDGKTWRGGYGPRIRAWSVEGRQASGHVDQLDHVVQLLQRDPGTRRAIINIYDPAVDTDDASKDIPCNNWLHFLYRGGKLHLHVATRSNDLMWGWSGINSFEWGALLAVVAGLTGLERGSLTFSISSLHLYEQHWDKAAKLATRGGDYIPFHRPNPEFRMPAGRSFDSLVKYWFDIEKAIREEPFGSDTQNAVDRFPEPMMRSWLQVLAGWWNPGLEVGELKGTSLAYALAVSPHPQQKKAEVPEAGSDMDLFLQACETLHRGKNLAYGDSWMKRGEQMAIMANIARKVDRLGVDGGGDTSLDTAQDLAIYLAKYYIWLNLCGSGPKLHGEQHNVAVAHQLRHTARRLGDRLSGSVETLEASIKERFAELETLVVKDQPRMGQVNVLSRLALALAFKLWQASMQPPLPAPVPAAETEQEFLGNGHAARNATRRFDGYNI